MPSLLQYGELNYGQADDATMEDRSMDCFGMHYSDMLLLDQVGKPDVVDNTRHGPSCLEKMALYNDPMLGMMDYALDEELAEKFARDTKLIAQVPRSRFDYLFKTQFMLARLLQAKTLLSAHIKQAYRSGDKEALQQIITREIPLTMERLDDYQDAIYAQWHKVNKPFGFEIQDLRQGGLRQRLYTTSQRIRGYLNGTIDRLEELEQPDLPRNPNLHVDALNSWRCSFSASVIAFS